MSVASGKIHGGTLHKLGTALLGAALLTAGTGCLVSSTSSQSRSGDYVAPATLEKIKPNQTTQQWVQTVVGNPTSKRQIGDGAEIWKYSYTERTDKAGAVFLIFGGTDSKVSTGTIFVQFKDGIVTNYWRG